ncbi:putative HVA22-like protein g [Hibiscus syriacus]|uniref:HVA22-like protein n=1 Tax=Hibiscus syriacus TaxID=106335 RepID=A0A6A2XM64_HIBSY|nr:putative HVA22-like protein g [Hibiscus syriacus]
MTRFNSLTESVPAVPTGRAPVLLFPAKSSLKIKAPATTRTLLPTPIHHLHSDPPRLRRNIFLFTDQCPSMEEVLRQSLVWATHIAFTNRKLALVLHPDKNKSKQNPRSSYTNVSHGKSSSSTTTSPNGFHKCSDENINGSTYSKPAPRTVRNGTFWTTCNSSTKVLPASFTNEATGVTHSACETLKSAHNKSQTGKNLQNKCHPSKKIDAGRFKGVNPSLIVTDSRTRQISGTTQIRLILGYAYPAFECFKTVEKNKVEIHELRFWCQYWILVAFLTVFERIGDIFISWMPMYGELKLTLLIYLWYPKTKSKFLELLQYLGGQSSRIKLSNQQKPNIPLSGKSKKSSAVESPNSRFFQSEYGIPDVQSHSRLHQALHKLRRTKPHN